MSAYLHPEFGYFCPSPGLRRAVRVAVAFAVIGVFAGAGGMATLVADHDPNLDSAATAARAEARSADAQPDASHSSVIKAEASPIVATRPDVIKSAAKSDSGKIDAAKSESFKSDVAKSDVAKSDVAKSEPGTSGVGKIDAGKVDGSTADAGKADAATTACEENTWAYLDGKCGSGKVRKMRIVHTAPAVGRTSPASAGAVAQAAPVASAPADRNGAPSKSSPSKSSPFKSSPFKSSPFKSSPTKSTQAPLAVATVARTSEPSQQPVAVAKKAQKTASRQIRRRDQATSNAHSSREVRPGPTGPLAFGPFGAVFGSFR